MAAAIAAVAAVALSATSVVAFGVPLTTFDDLYGALASGSSVRAISNYSQCTFFPNSSDDAGAPVGEWGPRAVGGTSIGTFEAFFDPRFGPVPFLAFSDSTLIQNYQGVGFIHDFVKTTVLSNGTVWITVQYIDALTYNVTMTESFVCAITSPAVAGGVSFYNVDPQPQPDPSALVLFQTFIVGEFWNWKQVEQEKLNPVHPFARHVSDIANQKMINLPSGFTGLFVLEESYYTNLTTGRTMANPMLFSFSYGCPALGSGARRQGWGGSPVPTGTPASASVCIASWDVPASIPPADLRNNNTDLVLDYTTLVLSSTFDPAYYVFDAPAGTFNLNAVTPLPAQNGSFTLRETLSWNTLSVLEVLVIDGQSVLPFDTPIIYNRI